MEFPPFQATALAATFAFLIFIYYLFWKPTIAQRRTGNNKPPPEAAGAWPIIGHLPLLARSKFLHITFSAIADKLGPIFTIKLGTQRVLVVNNWEMAKECLTTNDRAFASRPKLIAMELIGYNYAMFVMSPHGPYWRQVRKIAVSELLSDRQLNKLGHIRQSEVKRSIKWIYDQWVKNKKCNSDKVVVEMKQWFIDITRNVVVRIIAGKQYSCEEEEEEGVEVSKGMREFFVILGRFLLSDAFPFLRWLDLGGHEKAIKRLAKRLDTIIERWLQEHKKDRISGKVKDEQDFMDAMLSTVTQDLPCSYDVDTVVKSTCFAILSGGSDTTTVSIVWALALLLNNRHVLKKAQEELDIHVGRERQVEESDIKNLVYLQAILKETLRLYPPGPVPIPHESLEDCTVGGYHVPKGTSLMLNIWKIHRDPTVWSDPCEFRPERFLTTNKDVDVRGQHFEFIPFGSGRRGCPGITFALQVMHLTLATLLHEFEFETISNEPVDMTQSFGLTILKATPLELLVAPRLSSHLYG